MRLYRREAIWAQGNPVKIARLLYVHRSVIRQFTRRNIELQHKGSIFGGAWSVLNPLLIFAVYTFVFLVVFDGRFGVSPKETRLDYAIGIFLGLSLVQFLIETFSFAPLLVVNNPNFVKKVVFPIEILPVASAFAALFRCVVALILVLLASVIVGNGVSRTLVYLPIILLPLVMGSLGVSWLFAALGVFFRDLAQITALISLLLTFFSGVFYSTDKLPAAFAVIRLNPVLLAIEAARNALLWNKGPAAGTILYLFAAGTTLMYVGYVFFVASKSSFSEVL